MSPYDRRDLLRGIGTGAFGFAVGGVGIASAQADEDGDSTPARLRLVHASPDAPTVSVHVDGETAFSDVEFRDITDYLELPAGEYEVAIRGADSRLFEGSVSVEAGTDYTVAALGEVSEGTFGPHVLIDDDRRPVPNLAYVRVAHASPDAPAVDVTLFDGRFDLFEDVAFRDVTDYRPFPVGTFTAEVRPADGEGGEAVAETELALREGRAYTTFANGYLSPADEPANEPFQLQTVADGQSQPREAGRVRVAHASPDAPDVDVLLGGERVLSGVPFGTVSDYLEVPAGTATVSVTPTGDPDMVVSEGDLTVEAGIDYTIAALGEVSEETFDLRGYVDDNSTEQGRARVRVVHASPDAPAVDVTAGEAETTLVDGLSFGSASDYLSLQPGPTTVELRPDSRGNNNPFDAEFDLRLRPGRVYTAFAEGYFTTDDEPADAPFTLVTTVDAGGR